MSLSTKVMPVPDWYKVCDGWVPVGTGGDMETMYLMASDLEKLSAPPWSLWRGSWWKLTLGPYKKRTFWVKEKHQWQQDLWWEEEPKKKRRVRLLSREEVDARDAMPKKRQKV